MTNTVVFFQIHRSTSNRLSPTRLAFASASHNSFTNDRITSSAILLPCWGSNRPIARKLILNDPSISRIYMFWSKFLLFSRYNLYRPETLNNDSVARSLTDWVVELFIEWPILGRQNVICAECQHRWSGGNETITSLAVESKIRTQHTVTAAPSAAKCWQASCSSVWTCSFSSGANAWYWDLAL